MLLFTDQSAQIDQLFGLQYLNVSYVYADTF